MNYALIRDQLHLKLTEITGLGGKIYKRPRYSSEWATFFQLNTVTNPNDQTTDVVKFTWLNRQNSLESAVRDEADDVVAFTVNEVWRLTYHHGFSDDETFPSQDDFDVNCDAILEKFRWPLYLGFANDLTVYLGEPGRLVSEGLIELGRVLLHRAEIDITIVQRDVTP